MQQAKMETKEEEYIVVNPEAAPTNWFTAIFFLITHLLVFVIGAIGFLGSAVVIGDIMYEFIQEYNHVDNLLDKMVARDMKRQICDDARSCLMGDAQFQTFASLIFAVMYGVSSAMLIGAAMKNRSELTLPWIFCESVMFMTQMAILLCPPFYVLPEVFAFQPEGFTSNAMIMAASLFMFAVVAIMRVSWSNRQRDEESRLSRARAHRYSHMTGTIQEVRAQLERHIDMRALRRKVRSLQLAVVLTSPKCAVHGPQQIRTVA